MSLARILKSNKVNDTDIVSIIDKQCLSRGSFDFEAIRDSIDELKVYADKDVRSNDEFMKLFFQLYSNVYGEPKRSKGKFHPSGIMADCERKLYFEFSGFPETDIIKNRINGKLQRIFDVGTWWHTYIQICLWKAGILEQSETPVVNRKRRISGHADGVLRLNKRTLLEIKTMNSFSFAKGKHKPFESHQIQAGTYATELGIDQICFLYINKDTSDIVSHIVPVDKKLVGKAYDKMDEVLEAVEDKIAPARIHCTSDSSPMAKNCPYSIQCFKGRRVTTK